MIDYLVVTRKNPATKAVVYSAQIAPVTPLTLVDIAEDISRECTVTIHDIKAVVSAMEERIGIALLNGNSVRLGDLGSFRPTLTSKSTATKDAFKTSNITGVNVRFTKGAKFRGEFSLKNSKVKLRNLETEAGSGTNP